MSSNELSKFEDILNEAEESLSLLEKLASRLSAYSDCYHSFNISEERLFDNIPQRWISAPENHEGSYRSLDNVYIDTSLSTTLYLTPSRMSYVRAKRRKMSTCSEEAVMTISLEKEPKVWLRDLSFFSEFSIKDVEILVRNIEHFFKEKGMMLEETTEKWKVVIVRTKLGVNELEEYVCDSKEEAEERKRTYEEMLGDVSYSYLERIEKEDSEE